MQPTEASPTSHAFVLRVWWEPGLERPNGHALWRGRVQHATSGEYLVFASLDELQRFIERHTGSLSAYPGLTDE